MGPDYEEICKAQEKLIAELNAKMELIQKEQVSLGARLSEAFQLSKVLEAERNSFMQALRISQQEAFKYVSEQVALSKTK